MMTTTEKKWLANRLRKIAAEEALAGADSIAAEYLFQAEAVESGRHRWQAYRLDSWIRPRWLAAKA
jgi:hypothetical protein